MLFYVSDLFLRVVYPLIDRLLLFSSELATRFSIADKFFNSISLETKHQMNKFRSIYSFYFVHSSSHSAPNCATSYGPPCIELVDEVSNQK